MQDLLKGYSSFIDLIVQWGDMDSAQHVNNAMYLRYSETGRIAYFAEVGFKVDVNNIQDPVGPILAEVNCVYKAPLTHPDTITVATRTLLESLDEYSFVMEQIIVSHKLQRIAAQLRTRLVSYDYQALRKAPIPDTLRQKLHEREKNRL